MGFTRMTKNRANTSHIALGILESNLRGLQCKKAAKRLRCDAIHNRLCIDIDNFEKESLHGIDVTSGCCIVAAFLESRHIICDVLGKV